MLEEKSHILCNEKVSIISRSGGLLLSVYRLAMAWGLKIRRAVSSGNEAVVVPK